MTMTLSPILFITMAGSLESKPTAGRGGGEARGPASFRFVNQAGYRSHLSQVTMRSSWPFQNVPDVNALAARAARLGILYESPCEGDIYLVRDPDSGVFVRTGIVAEVVLAGMPADRDVESTVLALDGVRYERLAGQPCAFLEHLSSRRGDRFVRWVELDGRDRVGTSLVQRESAQEEAA